MTKKERKKLDRYYLRKYGISFDQREGMYRSQNGCCALCGKHEKEFKRRLAVEHSHSTGRVRSLCCYYCNFHRIGKLNLEWSRKVYEYFLRYDG